MNFRRASSPLFFVRPETSRSSLSLISPEGACGTLERFTAPAAPGMATRNRHTRRPVPKGTGQPLPESRRRGHLRFTPLEGSPPRKQVLRPAFRTRMDFAACCMSRLASFLLTRPRSCKLLPGHALGPSARLPGLAHMPKHMGPARCGHRSPLPVTIRHSRRAPYRSGMGKR